MRTPFLNVDLEIESATPVQSVTEAFGEAVTVLYSGETGSGFLAAYEVSLMDREADSIIRRFCSLIESLSQEARKEWVAMQGDVNVHSDECTCRWDRVSMSMSYVKGWLNDVNPC